MKYPNLIFDFGGVVLDIDYNLTINSFEKLGFINARDLYSQANQNPVFDQLEKGLIDPPHFYSELRKFNNSKATDDELRDAWNSLIISLPRENVEYLKKLKKTHRLFLLSNTNAIHEFAYRDVIIKQYGSFILDDLFEKIYLSHHLHMRKPDAEIFEYVIKDAGLKKDETLFIDDSEQHIIGAGKAGIKAVQLEGPLDGLKIED